MASKDVTHLLFLDIENTAKEPLGSDANQIIEIAWASLRLSDLSVVDSFETLIRPEPGGAQTIGLRAMHSEAATRILTGDYSHVRAHEQGIETEWDLGDFHKQAGHFSGVDWSEGMSLSEVLHKLRVDVLPGATLAGQNPDFDIRHLQRDFAALGIPWPETDYHTFDLCSPAFFLLTGGAIPGVSLKHSREWARDYLSRIGARDAPALSAAQQHRAGPDVADAIAVFRAMADVFLVGLRAFQ